MPGMNLGVLAMTLGVMAPRRDKVKEQLDRVLETGNLDDFHAALDRMERPVLASVDFGAPRATPKTGLRPEVVRSSDARPKGRGQRRREAAARKGKK